MISYQNMVDMVAARQGLEKNEVQNILDYAFNFIQDSLAEGEDVTAPIGKFKCTHRDARMGRNPKTGESIQIAASNGVKFAPNKAMKEALN